MCISRSALFVLMTLLPLTASSEWLEFGAGCPEGSEPLTFHDITLDDLIAFDVELQGLQADTVVHGSIPYLRFDRSPGTAPMDSVGYPELPAVVCFVAVPDESDLELTHSAACMETMECLPVYPAPLDSLVYDSTSTPYITEFFRKDSAAYASEEWYPEELAEIVGEFHLRDQRVAIVNVHPVQYLASGDSLRVWSDIELSIGFTGQDPEWSQAGLGYYDLLVGDMLLGYHPDYAPIENSTPTVVRHTNTTVEPSIDPDYVIIVADGLDGTWIDSFAGYRSDLNGFNVLITNLDDIITGYGGGYPIPTAAIIRDYMEALWAWSPAEDRPTYLLLIGDHETSPSPASWMLPTHEDAVYGGMGNDEWFVYIGEPRTVSSSIPDMLVGRLPARGTEEIEDMLDLIQDFEEPVQIPGPSARRHLIRLAGTDHNHTFTEDLWEPTVTWTESLKDWLGYSWDNYYCGDGNPTYFGDGSTLSSRQWTDDCIESFEHGAQVAFYSDHGDFHMFSAGLDWGIPGLGAKDSTFDNLDVLDLSPAGQGYCHPFVLMLCCTAGTFNHDENEHPQELYESLCQGEDGNGHPYDFGTDCLAEAFMRNTEGGAIGVFASSNSSYINGYEPVGTGILEAIYQRGITRTGDAILAGRLSTNALTYFFSSDLNNLDLGRFNLLGDPAVDIGDRVKFPSYCDIIISPGDLEMDQYPSSPDGYGDVILRATVRNAGGSNAGAFDVDLEIEDDSHNQDIVTVQCPGLEAGEEQTLEFAWTNHSWFTPPGELTLTAAADDPGGQHPDSWMGNNEATVTIDVLDFYPNEIGWPIRTDASVKTPPVLCDLDGAVGHDLEILIAQSFYLQVYRYDDPDPIWESDVHDLCQNDYRFTIPPAPPIIDPGNPSIPTVGNVLGSDGNEIVIDGVDELLVFDLGSSEPRCSFEHGDDWSWNMPHTVALGDFVEETDHAERDEIIVCRGPRLMIFDIDEGGLVKVVDERLIPPMIVAEESSFSSWPMVADVNGTGSPEIIVQVCWEPVDGDYETDAYIYDYDTEEVIAHRQWSTSTWRTIPCVGILPTQGLSLVVSSGEATSSVAPALVLDATDEDLVTLGTCVYNQQLAAYQVPYCLIADWSSVETGADRILANAENQCFVWIEDGFAQAPFPETYTGYEGDERPPFPALGELDDQDVYPNSDVLTATREGVVFGFSSSGDPMDDLGFPYILPSSVMGGFAIADIDNDGYVEVVFGTLDNYLHVWQLGECDEGYAPWPQCQHDAARTGVLLEE
jgi:hypothetical protein